MCVCVLLFSFIASIILCFLSIQRLCFIIFYSVANDLQHTFRFLLSVRCLSFSKNMSCFCVLLLFGSFSALFAFVYSLVGVSVYVNEIDRLI